MHAKTWAYLFTLLVCLSVYFSVCLSIKLLKKLWIDFHETWWVGEAWARDESIRFQDGSGLGRGLICIL